ncbi:capsule biosynthesis protein [uncultured Paracoccus sp.]|uniref:capsule biosynthesis protein n=1 Tax=uncultured Paracoccus sp. TaxID=189685 RepID=UPI00262139A2|nr:capsule biosynthesis protein [uncultured Paracoccus sp.]
MTTPPKARLYRVSREESVLARARAPGPADSSPGVAAATGSASGGIRVQLRRKDTAFNAARQPRDDGQLNDRPADPRSAAEEQALPPPRGKAEEMPFASTDDGFEGMTFPGAEPSTDQTGSAAGHPAEMGPIAAVRAENLTRRQLRMASRLAALHEIDVSSDHEAVVRLRQRGIDPFHREAVGQVLAHEGARARNVPALTPPAITPQSPPARRPGQEIAPIAPPHDAVTKDPRIAEIMRIQRDIARRRRRRLSMLVVRLAVLVLLPTILVGWYYFALATPLYATKSQFLIQQADNSGGGAIGGMFSGTQLATNPDSVSVQGYLNSRDAMLRLNEDLGFKRAFQDPSIDPVLRLAPDATNEAAYKLYQRMVKIGYDPTEGVIGMEVVSPDPLLSQQFALALIGYAEGQVDQMTARLREDQMEGAIDSYNDAEAKVLDAQNRVQQLQERMGVLDPVAEGSAVMAQVGELERQLTEKRLELGQLQSNIRPNQSRVQGVQGDISRLEEMIASTRAQLTEDTGKRASLASISGEIRIAESDLATRQQLLATAAAQMETARIEANKQVRYLSLSVAPVPPDSPTYPRAAQNTLVAFLIFSAIYLMMSLTASILREQVST